MTRLGAHKGAADEKDRIRIVLALAQGESSSVIAKRLSITAQTISKWRRRFESFRVAGLSDAPRPGPARRVSDEKVDFHDCTPIAHVDPDASSITWEPSRRQFEEILKQSIG